MARTGVLAALLLGLGAALLLRQAPAPETPRDRIAPVPPTAALAAGDRIAAIALGTSLTARALWPERLERVLAACGFAAAPVTVMARPGADSGEGPALVAAAGPGPYHLAFIEFAINDADLWDGVSRSESLANHRRIIRDLRSRNPDVAVVMVTTNPVSGLQRLKRPRLMAYNDLYVRLAGEPVRRLRSLGFTDPAAHRPAGRSPPGPGGRGGALHAAARRAGRRDLRTHLRSLTAPFRIVRA